MKRYLFDSENGILKYIKEPCKKGIEENTDKKIDNTKTITQNNTEQKKTFNTEVIIMNMQEFKDDQSQLVHKKNLVHSMSMVQYCKVDTYQDCLFGTMRVPKNKKGQLVIHNFGFYMNASKLIFIEDTDFVIDYVKRIEKDVYSNETLNGILLLLMEELLEDDVLFLQKQEELLSKLEEQLLTRMPEHFYELIMNYRKNFTTMHSYYEQLMNMGDLMQTRANKNLTEEERVGWQLYSNKAERLHNHVEMLREYLVQLRELYQSLIDVQQNKVMSILTVVTTIFLPLTLIVGWYGMNFLNMPELEWKYGYPVIIVVSIIIIVLEIIYFKKKKML